MVEIEKGKVVAAKETDGGHPLKQLMKLAGLTEKTIKQATISTFKGNEPPKFKLVARYEYPKLIKAMESATKAPSKMPSGPAWSFIIQGGPYGYTGGVRFNIRPDGSGISVMDGIGSGFESKAMAEMAKQLYQSDLSKPATYKHQDGHFVAVPN